MGMQRTVPEFAPHPVSAGGGTLAISPLPGRTRHYGTDWQRLRDWAPDLVVTMCQTHEMERKGAGTLGADLAAAGIAWRHLPVPDYGVPEAAMAADWDAAERAALAILSRKGKVLVHCFGGCGRSGMAVLRLMIAAGEAPAAALARLRAVRPCAVETAAQMDWATGGALTFGIHEDERMQK